MFRRKSRSNNRSIPTAQVSRSEYVPTVISDPPRVELLDQDPPVIVVGEHSFTHMARGRRFEWNDSNSWTEVARRARETSWTEVARRARETANPGGRVMSIAVAEDITSNEELLENISRFDLIDIE